MGSRRVLVVDDSRTVRKVVERMLVTAGFDVELAVDGKDALERATAHAPDLVLTDFVMPHMNGLRFVQAMRAVQNLAAVPVVLMSAKANRIGESFVAQTGALDAITKPFSPEALLAVTTHALSWAEAESHPPPPPVTSALAAAPLSAGAASADAAGSSPHGWAGTGALLSESPSLDEGVERARSDAAEKIAEALAELAVTARVAINPAAVRSAIERHVGRDALLSWAADLGSMVPDARGARALEGSIEHVALGDVLELLRHQRQTGTLEITPFTDGAAPHVITVCFTAGAIDLALERPSRPEFRIGRYAVEENLVEEEELERMLATRTSARQLLGTHLLKLGFLRPDDLTRLLTRQTSELVYEALRWRRGHYRFARLATRPEASLARLGIPVSSVLMEGLRRVDEWRLVEEHVRSFDDVFRSDPDAIARIDRHRLSREERTVLDAIDGARSVRDVATHVRMGAFDVGKILFQLVTARLVRR